MASLTNQPKGGRGCGKRKAGCSYGSMGVGPDGRPIWDFVLDPPIPWWEDRKFRGVHQAPDWLTEAILGYADVNEVLADLLGYDPDWSAEWIENNIVLVDMIGIGSGSGRGYATAPAFLEEVRRFGLSRRFDGINWSMLNGRKPWLVIGSPGSERITASIFQVLLRLRRQTPFQAVDAPRLYCDLKGKVSLEASRMSDDIPLLLKKNGFTVDVRDPYSFYLGCVQLAMREEDSFIGVADPRRDGAAGGPRL